MQMDHGRDEGGHKVDWLIWNELRVSADAYQ
jgi:hypothetical protein